MSTRIIDAINVLRIIRDGYLKDNSSLIKSLRRNAIDTVAERGVDPTTVFAHLVGKNISSKLSINQFEKRLTSWLKHNSMELKNWYLIDADVFDKEKINEFFNQPQILDTPIASDLSNPPPRMETTTYRILRDTVLSREVKIEHDYKCQICELRIELNDGSFYAESHHVKPLGKPHNGPDTKNNIMCVCPTCHVKLDYKIIKLDPNEFQKISREYIDYHNNEIT